MGYDYVPGNLAGALALREAGSAATRVDVGYFVSGDRGGQFSGGTRASAVGMIAEPAYAFRDGRIVSERAAKDAADVRPRSRRGRRSRSARASSSRCRAHIRACATSASGSAGSGRRRGSCRRCRRRPRSRRRCPACAARSPRRLAGSSKAPPGGPDAATRAKARSRIVAIASDAAGTTLATVRIEGASPYDFTAEMLAAAAIRAAGGGLRGAERSVRSTASASTSSKPTSPRRGSREPPEPRIQPARRLLMGHR